MWHKVRLGDKKKRGGGGGMSLLWSGKASLNMKIKCSLARKINMPLKALVANPAFYPKNSGQTMFCAIRLTPPHTHTHNPSPSLKTSSDCPKQLGEMESISAGNWFECVCKRVQSVGAGATWGFDSVCDPPGRPVRSPIPSLMLVVYRI